MTKLTRFLYGSPGEVKELVTQALMCMCKALPLPGFVRIPFVKRSLRLDQIQVAR